ncbi:anoctamin-10-like isoform X3 [Lissotriton helveticus]
MYTGIMGSWTPVPCQCCLTSTIRSLAVIQLRHAVKPEAKRWLISRLEGRKKDGGARLLVHPGEDDDGSMILLSATPYSLLRGTEVLGLAKLDDSGSMRAFSYDNRASFPNSENTDEFLTLAERQFLVKHEADSIRVRDEEHVPGYPKLRLYPGQPIENHRVESAFQNHLTIKVLAFRFFNCFALLFYITFYMQDLLLLKKRLASLLIVSQVSNQFIECILPYLLQRLKLRRKDGKQGVSEDQPLVDVVFTEGELPAYEGLFDDYMELFVQFGYASLFSCVYPLTAALLVLNNLTEIRTDALKICKLHQKPFPCPASNIGVWQVAFETLGYFAVITNCFLISISPEVKELCRDVGVTPALSLLYAVGVEHILIALKLVVAFAIPDEPSWVKLKLMQMDFCSWEALKRMETKQALAAAEG